MTLDALIRCGTSQILAYYIYYTTDTYSSTIALYQEHIKRPRIERIAVLTELLSVQRWLIDHTLKTENSRLRPVPSLCFHHTHAQTDAPSSLFICSCLYSYTAYVVTKVSCLFHVSASYLPYIEHNVSSHLGQSHRRCS